MIRSYPFASNISSRQNFNSPNLNFGQNGFLPIDLGLIIFQECKKNLHHLALVSKNWRALADDHELRQRIRPLHTFGREEWIEYFKAVLGDSSGNVIYEEPLLPRIIYSEFDENEYLLTFIPSCVTTKGNNIKTYKLHIPSHIGELFSSHLKKGNKLNLDDLKNWDDIASQGEKPHWVLMKRITNKDGFSYEQKPEIDKIDNIKISGLIDTIISIATKHILSPTKIFFYKYIMNGFGTYELIIPYDMSSTLSLRVSEKHQHRGLSVDYFSYTVMIKHCDDHLLNQSISYTSTKQHFGKYNESYKRPYS